MKKEITSNGPIKIIDQDDSKGYFLMDTRMVNGKFEFIIERKEKYFLAENVERYFKKENYPLF